MENTGKTIRTIRLSKGYSQKEVYHGIVSKSYAIEFEKGHHDMTVGKFLRVLDYLRLDFDEFQFIHHHYQIDVLPTQYQRFMEAANRNDLKALEALLAELAGSKQEKDTLLQAQLRLACLRLRQPYPESQPLYPQQEVKLISRYLLAVETWTLHEINLFANNLIYLPPETCDVLMASATKNLDKYQDFHLYHDLLAGLIVNYINQTFINGKLEQSRHYLTKLAKLSQATLAGWQRELYLFTLGCYHILTGERDKGIEMCRHVITYYDLIGYTGRSKEFDAAFAFYLKKSEKK